MMMIQSVKQLVSRPGRFFSTFGAKKAYDLWSEEYDHQPNNLMLQLDEEVFSGMLANAAIEQKVVADIGCGTGRHWGKLYARRPSAMMGLDVSGGMLRQLKKKFPGAMVRQTTNNRLTMLPDAFVDCIINTLTIAHIENIAEAIAEWARVLKPGGELLLTDFHPQLLAEGGRRSFRYKGRNLAVINYIHPLPFLKEACFKNGLAIKSSREIIIDEKLKPFYQDQGALAVYERYAGRPVIYGMHLTRSHAPG